MTVIGTNVASLRAANASSMAQKSLSTAMERLSTGKRVNSAKDDSAGLAIASSMTSQLRGMTQGIRNANDGISMAQTAEGALDEVTNMLQRMRELAVQKANGTYSEADIDNIEAEQGSLASQIDKIIDNTEFNGKKLFTGAAGGTGDDTVSIQAGANTDDTIDIDFGNLSTDTDLLAVVSATGTAPTAATIANYDDAISAVTTVRSTLGSAQNQLESAVNNLNSNVANLSDARSRIEDADFSAETANLAKAQILSQASTAMLAQANQSQQGVLSLLR